MDRSGSYALLPAILPQVADLLSRYPCPGGLWFARWVATDSFSDREIIFTLRMPSARRPCTNPFDRRCRTQASRDAAAGAVARGRAATALLAQKPRVAIRTDYWGFFAKASLILAGAPAGTSRLVIVIGDLVDDVGRRAPLDLSESVVLVGGLQSGADPRVFQRRQQFWRGVLKSAGSRAVLFGDPSQPLETLWLTAQSLGRDGER